MEIVLSDIGKRYNHEWIFKQVNLSFSSPGHYAITGPNGSGKSTLLQAIGGAVLPTEGNIIYKLNGKDIPGDKIFTHSSMVAPYLELVEEMTGFEFLNFHSAFKKLTANWKQVLQAVNLEHAAQKQIRYYSSGMKQRLKLAQAFFSDIQLLLIDEPTTNLDAEGISVYETLLSEITNDKLVIISSNDPEEYKTCREIINVLDYKVHS